MTAAQHVTSHSQRAEERDPLRRSAFLQQRTSVPSRRPPPAIIDASAVEKVTVEWRRMAAVSAACLRLLLIYSPPCRDSLHRRSTQYVDPALL
jgi:hypothetical protein